MAKLWKWSLVIFIVIGLMEHNEDQMMEAFMNTPFVVVELLMNVVLSACLWGGFLNVIEKTGFMKYLRFIFYPLLRLIYGNVLNQENIYTCLSSNFIANLLGLGSLATMSGLKAFRYLYEYSHHISREMLTLVIMNTAGFCLFPSSLIMLRSQFGSQNIYGFYPYMIIISCFIMVVGLLIQRLIDHE